MNIYLNSEQIQSMWLSYYNEKQGKPCEQGSLYWTCGYCWTKTCRKSHYCLALFRKMTKKMVKNSQINDQNEIQLNSMEKKMIFWKPSKAQGIEFAWIPRREGSRESTVLSGEISWFERKIGIHEREMHGYLEKRTALRSLFWQWTPWFIMQ